MEKIGEGGIEVGSAEGVGEASGSDAVAPLSRVNRGSIGGAIVQPGRFYPASAKKITVPAGPRQVLTHRDQRCVRVIAIQHITEVGQPSNSNLPGYVTNVARSGIVHWRRQMVQVYRLRGHIPCVHEHLE
jgi:hypothetical protein